MITPWHAWPSHMSIVKLVKKGKILDFAVDF